MELASRFSSPSGNGDGNGQGHHGLDEAAVQAALKEQSEQSGQQSGGSAQERGCSTASGEQGGRAARASERKTEKPSADAMASWRDARGRFIKGNPGGPGNPYNRAVAAAKRRAAELMTPERVDELFDILWDELRQRNMAAARLLVQISMPQNVDPDRVALHEWAILKEEATLFPEIGPLMKAPDPESLLHRVHQCQARVTSLFDSRSEAAIDMGPAGVQELRSIPQTEAIAIMDEVAAGTPTGKRFVAKVKRRDKRRNR